MKPVVTVKYVGEGELRRYYLHNRVGQYWNGSDWVYCRNEALLYENLQLCHEDYQRLITAEYATKPVQHFKVITHIVVRSDVPVTKKQLRKWLNRAYRGIVDTDACGDGPVEGSLAVLRTDFDRMKEVEFPKLG
jgi:hypothetical protein